MSLFNFNLDEMLSFFAVLMRYSVLLSVLPFFGDKVIPLPVRILLALSISVVLFPVLVAGNYIHVKDARIWGGSAGGLVGTIGLETLFALVLGFSSKIAFDGISFGANLIGTFMGFSSASIYDHHQESQTEVVAQIQTTIAMLLFLILDGHHLILRAALESYKVVGLGGMGFYPSLVQKIVEMTADVIRIGIQIAAPVAVSMFSVNVVFGILSKAMPQINVFMLSFAVSALIGLLVIFMSVGEYQWLVRGIFEKIGDSMWVIMQAIASRR
jgi:flagellar biosynthetic protein FliR